MTEDDKQVTAEPTVRSVAGTVSVRALVPLARRLTKAGVDPEAFLRSRGIDPAVMNEEEQRLPLSRLQGIWDHGAAVTRDPLFALHAAAEVEAHSFGLFSYLATTSETWGKALGRVCKYFQLVSELGRYETWSAGERATLGFVPVVPDVLRSPQLCDFLLGVPFTYASRLVAGFQLAEVLVPYPAPGTDAGHGAYFAAPVRFSAPGLAFVFPAHLLSAPLRMADARLATLLDGFACEKVAGLPDAGDPLGQLRQHLRQAAQTGEFSLEEVACRMALAPRTLQRRLADAGTSFAAEMDEARRLLAITLVVQPQLSLHEVAFILGFSEPAPFHRAFRRWTGSTPGKYRAGEQPRRSP
jgi:AraC-like DNA-binding protein